MTTMTPQELAKTYDSTKVIGHFETDKFVFFWGGPFSNWYKCNFTMVLNDTVVRFNCSEQAMMYMKADTFHDAESMRLILKEKGADKQKALGRKIVNYDESRWAEVREAISDQFLYEKFNQNEKLKQMLLDTGDKIICESSPADKIWGVGMHVDNPLILDQNNWQGLNLLGQSLMRTRDTLLNKHWI